MMASVANQQQPFPAAPPSLSAGDHEMRNYYAPQDAPRPAVYQTPYLTPYLGLRARLSQTFLNRWTILLLLILIRLLFAIGSTKSSLDSARREAISACTEVEGIGSSMASMPHFMAQGVNEMTASGVEKAVNGLMSMLELSVTGVEELVLFVVKMMTDTYLCLITLAVRGSMSVAVDVGTEIADGLNKTIDEVTSSMGDATKSVTDGINGLLDKVKNIPFVGDDVPKIDLTDEINRLKALEAPPQVQEGLQKLNDSIPTFEEVQKLVEDIVRTPFELIKEQIGNFSSFEFDRTLLPVPQKEKLSFCSDGNPINNFFDDLEDVTRTAKTVGLAVLIIAAVLVIIPMAWAEIRRYRTMKERSELFRNGHRPMDVIYLASRPHSSGFGLWLGQRFGDARRQTTVRWVWAYATSVPMLFILSLAIAGLLSCLGQYLAVRAIQKKVPDLTEQVADFAGTVVNSLNNASMSWSGGVNGAVGSLDKEINDEILGWVKNATGAVNGTLNTFVDEMSKTLDNAFGDSPLKGPIKDVLNCLIGLKIAGVQKGLTWVSDHAHVNFPGVNNDTFSLGALAKLSDSDSSADLLADPSGKARDKVTQSLNRLVEIILQGIRQEAILATIILCIFLAMAIGGLVFGIVQYIRRDKYPSLSNNDAYIINPGMDYQQDTDGQKAPVYTGASPPYEEYPQNKAAPYVIQPRPMPTFEATDTIPRSEKVGQVHSHAVAEGARPGHLRASSHGHLANPSPADENPHSNPFLSRDEKKSDPFRD